MVLKSQANKTIELYGLTVSSTNGLPTQWYDETDKYYLFSYVSSGNTEIRIYDNEINSYTYLWYTTITTNINYTSLTSLMNIYSAISTFVLKGAEIQQNETFSVQEFEKNFKLKNLKSVNISNLEIERPLTSNTNGQLQTSTTTNTLLNNLQNGLNNKQSSVLLNYTDDYDARENGITYLQTYRTGDIPRANTVLDTPKIIYRLNPIVFSLPLTLPSTYSIQLFAWFWELGTQPCILSVYQDNDATKLFEIRLSGGGNYRIETNSHNNTTGFQPPVDTWFHLAFLLILCPVLLL